jgi:hypothetical protein
VVGCCVGDDSGDKLARDERSEDAIDDLCKKFVSLCDIHRRRVKETSTGHE